jgi:hypothetical protein
MNYLPIPAPLVRVAALAACLVVSTSLRAAPKVLPNPDFTKGEPIPEGATHDWTLGATGARGWMHSHALETTAARQIKITEIAAGSPAERVLKVGDAILGVAGKPFDHDPRTELGKALTAAEATDGKLSVIRWRDGTREQVVVGLPVLGGYSPTAPYDCPKSMRILEQGCAALAKKIAEPGYARRQSPVTRSLNALALLASGERKYLPIIREEAHWAAEYSANGFQTWYYGYVIMLLAEYKMATSDASVMDGLERLALEAANGQSIVGSWGHKFAGPDGRLVGYGMMNAPGLPLTTSLVMARMAGVSGPEIDLAIDRSAKLLRFYPGKGAIPYGDHAAWIQTHEDNGKCGMAAVLFNLMKEQSAAAFFSRMSLASHGPERDCGHTGNFWNMTWAMPGLALSGPQASGAWMREFGAWYFDLARGHDGLFRHQGPPEPTPDSTGGWDATGAYLLAYAMPLKKIVLTGREPSAVAQLDAATARRILDDGRGWSNQDRNSTYDALDQDALLGRLASWSPVVRERAAIALGRRRDAAVAPLIALLDAEAVETRLGACQALAKLGGRAAPAVPKLRETLKAGDLWLRIKAADALAAIGAPAMEAVPQLLEMLAQGPTSRDPRGMEQRFLCFALFNRRGGLLGNSLAGVDRGLLLKAVRASLQNQDGAARGALSSVYANLSLEELEPLLPAIHEAIIKPAPSGIMFCDQIQTAGLELFAKHHIDAGIELLADYVRSQKGHASQVRIHRILELLASYGAHAQRVIPQLEAHIRYFENEETDFPKPLSLQKAQAVRDAITAIKAANDKPELILIEFPTKPSTP